MNRKLGLAATLLLLVGLVLVSSTGCYNRYQNPYYGASVPPPNGMYAGQQGYYQTPPVGYPYQPNPYQQNYFQENAYQPNTQNWQVDPASIPQNQVAPANYEYNSQATVPGAPQTFQAPANVPFNDGTFTDTGFRENSVLQQMPINQQAALNQPVTVPVNSNIQPTMYVPVDPAIPSPSNQTLQYIPSYNGPPALAPKNSMSMNSAQQSINVATLPDHDPQWQGVR